MALRDTAGKATLCASRGGWTHCTFCVGLLGLFIGTTIIFFNFFNDGIAEATGFFGFPCYLVGMTEIL